jgi:hypothetical protein
VFRVVLVLSKELRALPVAFPGPLESLGFSGGAREGLGRDHLLSSFTTRERGLNGGRGPLPETERRGVGDRARP